MLYMDYHVHCQNSPDSSEPLEEICKGAMGAGIKEIMITDHYEMFTDDFGRKAYQPEYLTQCLESVQQCREKLKDQLYVGFGPELGQIHLQPEAAAQITKSFPFDFVIASFHKIDNLDLKGYDYHKTNCRILKERYLDGLLAIARTGDFDCMGHVDLIKRYAAGQGVSIRLEEDEEAVRELFRILVNRNKGIEINTSGLRQAVKEQFPSRTLLKGYREEGGTIVTVGSDAHCRQDVGKGIQEAEKLLQELGFPYISRFRERKLLQEKVMIR